MSLNRPEARYQELARKWIAGVISPEEKIEFDNWYNREQDLDVHVPPSTASSEKEHRDRILSNIYREISSAGPARTIRLFRPSLAAAVLLLVLGTGVYFWLKNKQRAGAGNAIAVNREILPGGDKATLMLGDGSVLKLDELADGSLKMDTDFKILKKNGELIYETRKGAPGKFAYNTITTPKGGQFRVVLPDGSKVWLNASSSLQYPTTFKGKERLVRLTGEGYFEVAKYRLAGKPVPFRINVNDKENVEVLGTHFNIMAYSEEKVIKTTLLEGSVRVSKPGTTNSSLLKPGQQCVYHEHHGFAIRTGIDTEESISWKNGMISFKDADIEAIMRQVERWYDVKVEYNGEIPQRRFTGGISRKSNLSSLLKVLELNNIHFKVTDKTITVSP